MSHTLLPLSFYPRVSVGVLDNLVRNLLDITLDFGVCKLASDETLGGKEGVFGIDNGLTFSSDTNQTLAIFGEGDDRWSCASTCKDNKYQNTGQLD